MKRIFSLVLLGVFLFGFTGCQDQATSDPLADGVLTVGMEADYAPYNWTTTEDEASEYGAPISGTSSYADGYDVWISDKIATTLGVELEVKKISWDGLIPALQSGTIDMVVAGMSPTVERKEQINFSDAYYESKSEQLVVVSKDSDYVDAKTFTDLEGANISAQQGTFYVDLLEQLPLADDAQDPLPDYASLMQATTSGTIDGYLAEKTVADTQVEANDNLVALDLNEQFEIDPSMTTSAIGVAKGNEDLIEKINAALGEITAEERDSLMEEASSLSGEEA